jgi:hypothetical protein
MRRSGRGIGEALSVGAPSVSAASFVSRDSVSVEFLNVF